MIIIILAAGKGNRLKKTLPREFPYITKSLIKINNQPAIKRLINQFLKIKKTDILMVLGHKYKSVLNIFDENKLEYVINDKYEKDSNLRSLFLALEKIINEKIFDINQGVLVIEADSFLSDKLLGEFLEFINLDDSSKYEENKICWTTKGTANSIDYGGFIDPHEYITNKRYGNVKNIYIKNKPNYLNTLKMYGMTWFNRYAALDWYLKTKIYLNREREIESTGYFHEIIFKNLNSFTSIYYDFGKKALSFNNYEEYSKCLQLNKFKTI